MTYILQTKCIYCKHSLTGLQLYKVSSGEAACSRCGETPPIFTDMKAYLKALKETE